MLHVQSFDISYILYTVLTLQATFLETFSIDLLTHQPSDENGKTLLADGTGVLEPKSESQNVWSILNEKRLKAEDLVMMTKMMRALRIVIECNCNCMLC